MLAESLKEPFWCMRAVELDSAVPSALQAGATASGGPLSSFHSPPVVVEGWALNRCQSVDSSKAC